MISSTRYIYILLDNFKFFDGAILNIRLDGKYADKVPNGIHFWNRET